MRMLTASVALIALVFIAGCATLQRYPSFGTQDGGRLIMYDKGARNLLPPSARQSR